MNKKLIVLALSSAIVLVGCASVSNESAEENSSLFESADISSTEESSEDSATNESTDELSIQIEKEVNEAVSSCDSLSDELVKIGEIYDKYDSYRINASSQTEMNEKSVYGLQVWQAEVNSLLSRLKEADPSNYESNLLPEHQNWEKYVDTMSERMAYEYEGGSIQPMIIMYNKAMRYKNDAYSLASTLAELKGEVTFSLPDHEADGYYGNYDGEDYLIINEGMESGSYSVLIHVEGKDELRGYATINPDADDYSLAFTSEDGTISGSVSYFVLGATFYVTESDNASFRPEEVYDRHIKQDNPGVDQRIVHGVSPGENIMVNSVVIGKTDSDKLTLIAKDNHIVDIIGGELKSHGLEKLGEVDLDSAIIKTGLLRHAKVTPRVISDEKPDDFKVTFLDHAGEDVYRFRDSSLVITVGDDTTLISSDILYRFDIPVIGITDGDLDKVVEDGFKVKDSIIFEVESGFDDIIGQNIKSEIFCNRRDSHDFKDIDEVKEKIEIRTVSKVGEVLTAVGILAAEGKQA